MTATPSHQELQDMLPALALGVLEESELEEVANHLRDCEACSELVEQYRAAAAGLALALPRRPWRPERVQAVRARLLDRARAGRRMSASASREMPGMRHWSGWLVAAALAGVLLIHHSIHRPLDFGWMVAGVLCLVLLAVGVYAWIQRYRVAALEAAAADLAREMRAGSTGRLKENE